MAIGLFKRRKQTKNKKILVYSENHECINDLIIFLSNQTNINVLLKSEGSAKKDNQGYFIFVDEQDFCKASIEGLKFATMKGFDELIFFSKDGKRRQKIAHVKIEPEEAF